MTKTLLAAHYPVVVVGGGQAGLSASWHLTRQGIEHVIFEKHSIAHTWKTQRWDAFCLVTPNWQCQLPDFPYPGGDPHGFMVKDDIVAYVEEFARRIDAPVRQGVAVLRISRSHDVFHLETSVGKTTADAIILAVSAYHVPNVPRIAERLPQDLAQIHSSQYRNSGQLPEGAVMVVGSGQSGCQIAEDLHLAGRQVHLVTGSAPRCPRFYRGRDAVDWLSDLGQYDLPVEQHSLKEQVRKNANHYLTGRDGGRDIDLRQFAKDGMKLYGRLTDISNDGMHFKDDLVKNLDAADAVYNGICALIDRHIEAAGLDAPVGAHYQSVWQPDSQLEILDAIAAGITSIIWSTGFRSDWSFVELPIFDATGYPAHRRGITSMQGVYVLGMPWLWTWGSGRFLGVGKDAEYVVAHLAEQRGISATPALKEAV
jgi:putative flavoprotein involved in K+ transport